MTKYKYSRKEIAETFRLIAEINYNKELTDHCKIWANDLLATISPEEESQKIMMEQVDKEKSWICDCGQKNSSWAEQCGRCEKSKFTKSSKEKEIDSKLCIAGDFVLLSYPPQYKCKNCGQTWFSGNPTPTCKMFKEFNTPTPSTNIKEIGLPKKLITVDNCAGLTQFTFEQEFKDWIKQVTNSLNTIIKK